MKKFCMLLLLLTAAGCATVPSEESPQGPQAAQTTQKKPNQGWVTPKVNQWFVTDTPETLPADKLKKMQTTGVGFGGAY